MSSLRKKVGGIPPLERRNCNDKSNCDSGLLNNSFKGADSISKNPKEETITLYSATSNTQSSLSYLPLYPSDNLLDITKTVDSKPKKRVRSEAGPKCRKRNRMKYSSKNSDDDQNLDNDLLGLAKTVNIDKNLDSDSSEGTIILDDSSDNSPNDEVKKKNNPCDSVNSIERTTFNQSAAFNNSSCLSFSNFLGLNEENKPLDMRMLGNISKNTNNIQSSSVQLPKFYNNVQSTMPINKKVEEHERHGEAKSGESLLRDFLSAPKLTKSPLLGTMLFTQNTVTENSTENLLNKKFPNIRCRKKERKNIPASSTASNFQSVYASMGLDEDLCDINPKKSTTLDVTSKKTCIVDNPLDVPIKTEKEDECTDPEKIKNFIDTKNENQFHVSMTFEAEPCGGGDDGFEDFDDDDDEDLPLSILKNDASFGEKNSALKHKTKGVNSSSEPIQFVKKESIIEDEIVSESQAISSKNLVSVSNTTDDNSHSQRSFETLKNDLIGVKVKTEPLEIEYSHESIVKNLTPSETHSNEGFAYGFSRSTMKSSNINNNDISDSLINEDVNKQNNVITNASLNTKPQYINKKSKHNISSFSNVHPPNSLDFPTVNKNSDFQSVQGINKNKGTPNVFNKSTPNTPKTKRASKPGRTNKKKNSTNMDSHPTTEKSVPEHISNKFSSSALSQEINKNIETFNVGDIVNSNVIGNKTQQNTNLKNKGTKRKKVAKKFNKTDENNREIDENEPLTLVIKRKSTNPDEANEPDSFLCTKLSNKTSDCSFKPENTVDELNKNPHLEEIDVVGISSDSFDASGNNNKKKKQRKNKQNKEKVQKNISTSITNDEEQAGTTMFMSPLEVPINNLQSDANIFESSNIPTSKSSGIIKTEQESSTFVEMTFEETAEEAFNSAVNVKKEVDLPLGNCSSVQPSDSLNLIPVEKHIKKEMGSPTHSDNSSFNEQLTISSHDSQLDETMSTISTLTSSSMGDISSKTKSDFDTTMELNAKPVSKKKKKRVKKLNWYKKKKAKSIPKSRLLEYSEEISQMKEPSTTIIIKDLKATANFPVVVLKSLHSDVQNKSNTLCAEKEPVGDNLYAEEELVVNTPEQELVNTSSKGKKKKGKASRRKRKKSSVHLNSSSPNIDSSLENNLLVKITKDSRIEESHIQKELSSEEIDHCSKKDLVSSVEHISIRDQLNRKKTASDTTIVSDKPNTIANRNGKIFPSLNIEQIAQELAGYEAMVNNDRNVTASEKIILDFNKENNTEYKSESEKAKIMKELESQSENSKNIGTISTDKNLCDVLPNSATYIQTTKENDNCFKKLTNSSDQSSLSSHNGKGYVDDKTNPSSTLLTDSRFIKKEKNMDDCFLQKSCMADNIEKSVNQQAASVSSESRINYPSVLFQNSQPADIDTLGLTIKKEVCQGAELVCGKNIKDQNDLIHEICKPHLKDAQNNWVKSLNDDEIQVLPIEKKSNENIIFVDLTDNICTSNSVHTTPENASQFNTAKNLTSQVIEHKETIKQEIQNSESISVTDSHLALKDTQLESFKEQILTSGSVNKEVVDDNLTKKTFILREKYIDDYFTHPFPPSIVLYNKKQRNRDNIYTRINSPSWNLTIDKVEFRLKHSENTVPQFGKKLGDIVKLEKYPVSFNEVECYHRILGVAPSRKLLSKCFASPDKKYATNIRCDLENSFKSCQKVKIIDEDKMQDVNDLLQGIAETRMMHSGKNNSILYDRDCPSTDTKDSFDSYISNASEKSYITTQNKDINNSSNLFTVKENQLVPPSKDASSSGRNSVQSCPTPDFQDPVKSVVPPNVDFSNIKTSDLQCLRSLNLEELKKISFVQNNLSTDLTLPSKQIVEHIMDQANQSLYVETSNTSFNSAEPRSDVDVNNPPLQYAQAESVMMPDLNTNEESKLSLDMSNKAIDVFNEVPDNFSIPATSELLKILQTVGSLNTDTGNCEDRGQWKNKATFEYNHTQSIPVAKANSECASEHIENFRSIPPGPSEIDDNAKEQWGDENSDDEYVENEPIHNESDEEDANSSHTIEEVSKEPVKIPQYKSKWEKIMERKSQELKEKKQINEHLLKDCYPVSSAVKKQSTKSHLFDKNISKSTSKNSNKKEYAKAQDKSEKLSEDKSDKQNKTKHKVAANTKKQNSKFTKFNKTDKSKTEQDTKKKSLDINSDAEDSQSLFSPDNVVKTSSKKTDTTNKSKENERSKRFYGNRVTNRGTFLTETKLPKVTKNVPKKIAPEITKKPVNRSEEFHSLVKSPDIDIEPNITSKYKNLNKSLDSRKNSELYKSPLSDNQPSTSSHFVCTKRMRNRQFASMSSQFPGKRNIQNKRTISDKPIQLYRPEYNENSMVRKEPHLNCPPSTSSLPNNECMEGRKIPLLVTSRSEPSHPNNEDKAGRKIPLLVTPRSSSISSLYPNDEYISNVPVPILQNSSSIASLYPNDECLSNLVQVPVSNNSSSIPAELPSNCLLQQIISGFQKSNLSPVPEVQNDILPPIDPLNTAWDSSKFNLSSAVNKPAFRQQLNTQSNIPVTTPFRNIPSSEILDPRKAASRISSVSNLTVDDQFEPFDSDAQSFNSPLFSTPSTCSSGQAPTKATCLVPQHLKSLVGHETIETHNVRLLMLEWSVDWLMQQQQFQDPPPISNAIKKAVSKYETFEDYYNTYFPLMLLDTWHRIYVSWTHLSQTSPYSCQITSYTVRNHCVSVGCETVFNTDAHPKGVFPDEGSILMVKYATKSNEYSIKILGYVTHVKTRRFNSITDSRICSSLKLHKDVKPEVLQILSLTFMGAYNSEDIDKQQPVRIHVLCSVKPTLKQNDALLHITKSPLQRSILNPVADGLRSLTLIPRNSSHEKTNECVRDITKGILSPHPLPLLTVVRAKPESDRLNIIPLLIEKMKNTYKTKVLLCVRTVRALGDIAANICLNQSLRLVIVNKRCDTNPQFQKYLLDELVTAEMKKQDDEKAGERMHFKNEMSIKIKKRILSDCDVVLSLVRNSHDDFMGETFEQSESIAQMCCIVDEANLCTEPETLIPILHGISKLILIGDPDYSAKVLSKTASSYNYSQSFFQRAYDLDLLDE